MGKKRKVVARARVCCWRVSIECVERTALTSAQDEVTALESALEERHALELAALDAREQKAQDTPSVSVLADGLSSCRLGSDDVKPVRRPTGLTLRPDAGAGLACWRRRALQLERVLRLAGHQADARAKAAGRARGGGGRARRADS